MWAIKDALVRAGSRALPYVAGKAQNSKNAFILVSLVSMRGCAASFKGAIADIGSRLDRRTLRGPQPLAVAADLVSEV